MPQTSDRVVRAIRLWRAIRGEQARLAEKERRLSKLIEEMPPNEYKDYVAVVKKGLSEQMHATLDTLRKHYEGR